MAKRAAPGGDEAGEAETGTAGQRLLEAYLTDLKEIRSSGAGVAETSFYPALATLFSAVGKTLKPKVRCVMNLRNLGAGLPDGGLFTADQFQRQSDGVLKAGQPPARGAIEAKGTKPEATAIAKTQQVKDYLDRYGIVIVTNLRDFLIVERDANGLPAEREAFALAENEADFWQQKAAHPRATAQSKGEQFIEFIKRACLHNAPLVNPRDVAWFLASYARDALFRVEHQKQLPALQTVRAALEEALGMTFSGEKGEHFFRSSLVQTLFYGVFSAWVRWHKDSPGPKAKFDWRTAEWSLHVPFIRTLYEEVAKPSRLGPLGLVEVLNWSASVLNRVDRGGFFARFEDEHAVQYFYEPFLEAYDPELRKELGVWYTPREIVKYQVARVDRVLRDELDLADGLADPNVIVLDPCCGTGAYLVEVLHSIAATLREKGGDALVASDLKQAAMHRIFGFEILPAPFVVSHLELGLMLQAQGTSLAHGKNERVGVYLTNALTGWEPPKGPKQQVMTWAELQDERDAAEHVKRDKKILVVLGNPPYNAFAGVSPEEELGLVEPYKQGLREEWGQKRNYLDDLYVRFFRIAERRIAEMSGKGVVSFISSFSYLSDPSYVVMRQRLLAEFDGLWLDCMNGDSRETGKLTPDGKPDPSVFSTPYNREGIRVGTAVCVIVRKAQRQKKPTVRFRHFWGAAKRAELLESLKTIDIDSTYELAEPASSNRYSFRPEDVSEAYEAWASVRALARIDPFLGLNENRSGALQDIDKHALEARMQLYFDAKTPWQDYVLATTSLSQPKARFDPQSTRAKAISAEAFNLDSVLPYTVRPLDTRWCYWTGVRPVWNEPRPQFRQQVFEGSAFLATRPGGVASPEGVPFLFTRLLSEMDSIRGHSYHFPVRLKSAPNDKQSLGTLFDVGMPYANLSDSARAYLGKLGLTDPDTDAETAGLIWMHTLAIGYSSAYLTENADGIRRDWPRIPLPNDRATLEASAALGDQIAALLDTEAEVPGVTSGKVSSIQRTIGLITKTGGGQLDTGTSDLAITAGWAHYGKAGAVMPGKGKLSERQCDAGETKAIEEEAALQGMSTAEVKRLLGERTYDVYLNNAAYWRNIPVNVWEYYIGGYQVIKKWLSYRENEILGRALNPDEAREVMNIARRITALVLLQPKLDENYQTVKAATFDWPSP